LMVMQHFKVDRKVNGCAKNNKGLPRNPPIFEHD
jgi:hypothetical protein